MGFKEVRELMRSLAVEGLVCGDQNFEIDSLFDREPVKDLEDCRDMVSVLQTY